MEAYMRLYFSTGWKQPGYHGAERVKLALSRSWLILCAYAGDELIGSGRIISDGVIHAFITEVFVLPEWQGHGAGKAIMQYLLERCKEADISKVQLFAAPGKREFYRKLGFFERGNDAPGMDMDE
ncbi:MAG: GNAT family N-acetyltransferase [Brevinematales bacterium]|nr:GNAT family N-acetyltransferase [Brevinematales bacterium]